MLSSRPEWRIKSRSLISGSGNNTVDGGKSNDKRYGDTGSDRLDGQEGDDIISGGLGTDTAVEDDDDSLVSSIEIRA